MDLEKHACPKCKGIKSYNKEYDTYYCKSCNEWLEDICTDRDCPFCKDRPFKPNDESSKES